MKRCTQGLITVCVGVLACVAGQQIQTGKDGTMLENARPERPYDVQGFNVTYSSIDVVWTSGSDEGAAQQFNIIRYLGNGTNTYEIYATNISGPYNDSGSGQNWTYHLSGLYSDTDYRLAVQAQNKYGTSVSEITLIRTSKYTNNQKPDYTQIYVAIFVSLSVCMSLLVFAIYIITKKCRQASRHVSSRTGLIQSGNGF